MTNRFIYPKKEISTEISNEKINLFNELYNSTKNQNYYSEPKISENIEKKFHEIIF